ncbi:MAG: hypothetical protein JO323_05875 [Acidobacteriia bacterium]|nr:hypothetical protein [Terriglobia bacterium]
MPELEPAGKSFAHIRECSACARLLAQQRALRAGLKSLAKEQAGAEPPARLETALLQEFRRQTHAWRGRPAMPVRETKTAWWLRWPAWASAAAVTAALVLLLAGGRVGNKHAPSGSTAAEAETASYLDSGFVPLPYASVSSLGTEPDLVRLEMPRSALVTLGVPGAADVTGDSVEAEVLLGDGGVPEAVRLVE